MKLFKLFIKSYLVFGLGVVFGAVVATLVTYSIMTFAYGSPDAAKIFQIKECLEERVNE
tara:strand:+ start:2751 stop:2927 length:177 start_codon:yes stop_codon:yes gene_type:complete